MPEQPSLGERSPLPVEDYHFRSQGRSPALVLALAAWLAALAGLYFYAQATPWLIALLFLPVIPGLFDLAKNPGSGLDLTSEQISWFTGGERTDLPLSRIARLRFDTRLDLSIRATLILTTGEKLRLPQPVVPPVAELTRALDQRGVAHERHHFSLF